ncbi:MAG TPA: DUF72 domain-containing protein [Cytophagaceae bacterium]|jgi:uncharacterized protein YecE (DUF72 family)
MEFGNVQSLEGIDLVLPRDHSFTKEVLANGQSKKITPNVYVGCAKWGRKEWVNMLYPKSVKAADFLDYYSKQFNAVELNASFYGLKKTDVLNWKSKVPDHFKFCPKFPSTISVKKTIKENPKAERFIDTVRLFEHNLGPVFLMLTDKVKAKEFDNLQNFINELPTDVNFQLELRNEEWYQNQQLFDDLTNLLHSKKIGFVITDVAGRRDILHQCLTTSQAFVRFQGYNLHPSDYKRIDEWVLKVKGWFDLGLKELFYFLHELDETHTPAACEYFIKKLNKACNLKLQNPQFLK